MLGKNSHACFHQDLRREGRNIFLEECSRAIGEHQGEGLQMSKYGCSIPCFVATRSSRVRATSIQKSQLASSSSLQAAAQRPAVFTSGPAGYGVIARTRPALSDYYNRGWEMYKNVGRCEWSDSWLGSICQSFSILSLVPCSSACESSFRLLRQSVQSSYAPFDSTLCLLDRCFFNSMLLKMKTGCCRGCFYVR